MFTVGIGVGLPVWLFTSTYYKLNPGVLLVRCGPFTFNVPLEEITSITSSTSVLSSPALSLDRLRIHYGQGKSLMISPRDKEKFLRDLRVMQDGETY